MCNDFESLTEALPFKTWKNVRVLNHFSPIYYLIIELRAKLHAAWHYGTQMLTVFTFILLTGCYLIVNIFYCLLSQSGLLMFHV